MGLGLGWDIGIRIGIEDWLGFGIEDQGLVLGIGIGDRDLDWGLGFGIEV